MNIRYFLAFLICLGFISCGGSNNSTTDTTISVEEQFNKGMQEYNEGDWVEAQRIFEAIRVQSPTSPFAAQAMFLAAMSRYKQETYSSAAVDFRMFRRTYPSHELAPRAQYMIGESYYGLSPKAELDQTYTQYAINEYQAYIRMYSSLIPTLTDSADARIKELRDKLAMKHLLAAELYIKLDDRKAALLFFDRVLADYYDTRPAIEAQLRIAEIQADRKKMKEASEALAKFEDRYLEQATQEQRNRARNLKSQYSL
jgi:outer membrane protein assembly factor BamD